MKKILTLTVFVRKDEKIFFKIFFGNPFGNRKQKIFDRISF